MKWLKIALVGNPNCGKTALFNRLCGENGQVGNYTGVTVEKKTGTRKYKGYLLEFIDLPGVYSLCPYTQEEKITAYYLDNEEIDVILNVLDGTTLERNLYLTLTLSRFAVKTVAGISMTDILEKKDLRYDCATLQRDIGIPFVSISAKTGQNMTALLECLIDGKKQYVKSIQGERERYQYAANTVEKALSKPTYFYALSEKIDRIIAHKYLGIPIFFVVMFLVFRLSFGEVVSFLSAGIEFFFLDVLGVHLSTGLMSIGAPQMLRDLICDGMFRPVGTVLAFLPQILILSLLISLLEDWGYMARVAFIMDAWLRKIGLSGRAMIPLIMGFGCNIPAILSARCIESHKGRCQTVLMIPFMSCGARLPLFIMLCGIFTKSPALSVFLLYLIGVVVAIISGIIFKKTLFRGADDPFVIEMPIYKAPMLTKAVADIYDRCDDFVKKVLWVAMPVGVILWFLQNFTGTLAAAQCFEESILYACCNMIAPIFGPLGFGNAQAVATLTSGLAAKEATLSTLSLLYGANLVTTLPTVFSAASAWAFMVFVLLYTPCVAAVAAIRKETGRWKYAVFSVGYQGMAAYVCAWIMYNALSYIEQIA